MYNNNFQQNPLINKEEDNELDSLLKKNNKNFFSTKINRCTCNICSKIPLSCCFFMISFLFLLVLIAALLTTILLLIEELYVEINDIYITNYVIDPIINVKSNYTQSYNIRNEVLDDIYLESKISNLQIATEFITENLQSSSNKKMVINDNFKPIASESYPIYKGIKQSSYYETEENYFVYEEKTSSSTNINYNLISAMTHYLKIFEKNTNLVVNKENFLTVKEFFIYNQNNNGDRILLTYCDDWKTDAGFVKGMFQNKSIMNDIINDINNKSNNCVEYIVRNLFLEETEINLMKFKSFNITDSNNNIYNFVVCLRLDLNSIKNLFNKQNFNVTTIVPITELKNIFNTDKEMHFIYSSEYFINFYTYGSKNLDDAGNYLIRSQYSDDIIYDNANLNRFFELLHYYDSNSNYLTVLYNTEWRDEYVLIGQIIKQIYGDKYFPKLTCENGGDDIKKNNIMCDCNRTLDNYFVTNLYFKEFYKNQTIVNFEDLINDLNETSKIIINNIYLKNRNKINVVLQKNVFNDLKEQNTYVKIIYYNMSINSLSCNNIEVFNVSTYNSAKELFIQEMNNVETVITIIVICFAAFTLIFSVFAIIFEIRNATERIKHISSLKDMLFSKSVVKSINDNNCNVFDNTKKINEILQPRNMSRNSVLKDVISNRSSYTGDYSKNYPREETMNDIIQDDDELLLTDDEKNTKLTREELEKKREKIKEKWSKKHIYDSDFFINGNKIITRFTYNHLKRIFEGIDTYQNEKFAEKLLFLKRKYKLNEQNEGKEDCDLSSDIYQAISKICLINIEDISYNVYYNQSYALNQAFRMFKSILDNTINKQSVPLRNNKYINFGSILKIIYYFKKEKIQKIIEIIFAKDLKYKHKTIEELLEDNYDLSSSKSPNIMNMKTNTHLPHLTIMNSIDIKNTSGKRTPGQRFKRRNSFCHTIKDT